MSRAVLLVFVPLISGLNLPSYIEPCSRHDPNLQKCIMDQANKVIPLIAPKGDKNYRMPRADPLIINELEFSPGSGTVKVDAKGFKSGVSLSRPTPDSFSITILAKRLTVTGLKDSKVVDLKFNYKDPKQHYDIHFYIPGIEVKGKYTASGRVLLLPITGNGDCIMNLTRIDAKFSFDNELIKRSDGLRYPKPVNPGLTINIKGMKIYLTNLFNGNKLLADNMNQFLNENWGDVFQEIGPTMADAMEQFLMELLENMFDLVPFEYSFKD